MSEDLHNIDKLFKAAIDGLEETPADESWKLIDKKLDASNIASIRKKYANLKKLVAVLLLLLSCAIAYEWHSAYSSKHTVAVTPIKKQDNPSADNNNSNTGTTTTNNNIITGNAGAAEQTTKLNTATTENQAGTISTHVESVQPDDKSITAENNKATEINKTSKSVLEKNNTSASTATTISTKENRPVIKTAHSNITIRKKAQFFATTTNAEVGDTENNDATSSTENNIDIDKAATALRNKNTNSLKFLPRYSFEHSFAEPLAIQATTMQNPVLPKTTFIKTSATINSKTLLNKPSRFSATVFYSPGLTSDLLKDDDGNNNRNRGNDDAAHIKRDEDQSSYSLGALIEYAINKHWSIQSGLTYIQKINRINPKTIYAADPGNGNIGYLFNFSSGYSYLPSKANLLAVGDSAQASRSTNLLQYLSIPLQAKYTITKGKFSFSANAGAAYNFLLKGTLETEVENGTTKESESINKIAGLKPGYISGLIGVGTEYPLTKKIGICFNPSFNMALTSITQGAPIKSYPSFFSFAAGLHFQL